MINEAFALELMKGLIVLLAFVIVYIIGVVVGFLDFAYHFEQEIHRVKFILKMLKLKGA